MVAEKHLAFSRGKKTIEIDGREIDRRDGTNKVFVVRCDINTSFCHENLTSGFSSTWARKKGENAFHVCHGGFRQKRNVLEVEESII